MPRLLLILLVACFFAPRVHAQGATDLYLLEVVAGSEDDIALGPPVRLTNRDGYDNQPAFSADGSKLYFTSMQGEQTDIWQIELGEQPVAPKPFRQTPESEYSPTPIPGQQALSVIRVEADGKQRLWRLPLDPAEEASVILPDVEPVGYHAWSKDGRELVLFVLDEPHRLVRVGLEGPERHAGEARTISRDIGRSLHRIPGREAFAFIDKSVPGWRVAGLSIDGDRLETIVPALEGREDVAFSGQALWGGDGTRLLRAAGDGWQEVIDLGEHGISSITRLAFDGDGKRLALVAQRSPEKVRRLEIVDKAIEHHGGKIFSASETRLRQCSRSGCSQVLTRVEGDHFTYDVSAPRREITQRVRSSNDRLDLWRGQEKVEIEAGGEQRLRDWAMARVYFPFLPYRLNDPSVWKQDLGVEVWRGQPLHKVRVTFDSGSSTDHDDVYLYWFDAETAELVQFAYSYSGDPGGLRFRVLENERRIGGLLFHDQKNYGTEGTGLTVERLTPEVVDSLRLVSTVTFEDISVSPIPAASH